MVANTMQNVVGERVRRLRAERGWTQGQLAQKARVGRSWLSVLETAGIDEAGAGKLERVALALDVDSAFLLTGKTSDGELKISGPSDKVAILRRFARYPADVLARFERAIGAFYTEDIPPTRPIRARRPR